MAEQIRRVLVWSAWVRFSHWTLAVATLWLMATGWLIGNTPSVADAASELHYLGAGLLVFALGVRLVIGFYGSGAERFDNMLPQASELGAVRASLLFYATLGKAPLPNWFAHNPLWKLIYLFMLLVLGLLALSGWLMPDKPLIWRFYLPSVHASLAMLVGLLVAAHVYCVVLQDWKGRHADTSAMINGDRYFGVERDGLVQSDPPQMSIRLDDVTGKTDSKRDD